ncbi:Mediator of RNA polymerase II transcription subunit 26 [Fasciola hepatica]|uniref:Mediator of RNA polymerase II transcription subunit 26 n=1 Tax=Fasciola hepatica TaxID=6192 RepID=A0A4E0S0E1_FASHE|nr:Mediator of RNA polymerase II transcription subunit 26 [Fasciola hepatica]
MYDAVMSNTLNSIMLTLRNGLDTSQNITNTEAVLDAVTQLELFPMTMTQLQDTRIGQLLQLIRHKVDPALQKRIRFVIKAWQKLLSPNFTANSVIPLKCADLGPSATASPRVSVPKPQHSNGTSLKSMYQEKPNSAHTTPAPAVLVDSPRASESRGLKRTYLSASSLTNLPNKASDSSNDNTDSPFTNQRAETPSKRFRYQQQSVPSPQVKPATATATQIESHSSPKLSVVNGGRHIDIHLDSIPISKPSTPFLSKSNSMVGPQRPLGSNSPQLPSRDGRATQAARLAKVKSTAELVQAAGDCIDSATADRILTNRINKEADPPRPSIVPQLTRTRQPRNTSSSAHGAVNETQRSRPTTPRSTRSGGLRVDTPARSTPANLDSRPAQINHVSRQQDTATPSLTSLDTTRLTTGVSPSPDSGHVPIDHKLEAVKRPVLSESEPGAVDSDSDTQRSKHKKHRKHKHRHKHRGDGSDSGRTHRHEQTSSKLTLPPITNNMNDWPQLPPLPSEIDWYNLDRPAERPAVPTIGVTDTVTRLLSEPWPEVNRTVDDQGLLHLPTELYSLTLDDQYLHVLPWIDIVGHKRKFFPPDDDLDQLTVLPDPW